MFYKSWRGVIGVVKPTYRPGSLEEFIRLLPEGIGVIPLFQGIKTGKIKEFQDALDQVKEKVGQLAEMNVDLIHPEGAPLFIQNGYKGEQETVRSMEEKHGIPIFTSTMTQVESLKALDVNRLLGITYVQSEEVNALKIRYFSEAGFNVLGWEGMTIPFSDVGRLTPQEVYAFTKKQFLKHKNVEGILLSGSGWRILDIIQVLEQDLQVPVVHAITARIFAVMKRLYVRQPIRRFGRLLEGRV